jgi:hypothetical protein
LIAAANGRKTCGTGETILSTAEADDEILRQLRQAFRSLWRLGSHALVGWRESPRGIEVLTVPKIRLFTLEDPPRRVFSGERHMGGAAFDEVARFLGAQPIELRLPRPVGDMAGEIPVATVEGQFVPLSVLRTEARAVLLLDIVGFSKNRPEMQAAQLATLDFVINLAGEATVKLGFPFTMERSTTGDGYYVWNSRKGMDEDVALFVFNALLSIYYSAIKRTTKVAGAVPDMRGTLSVGSHYTYHRPSRGATGFAEYIVGEVTIAVARLIGNCRAGQVMVGEFVRPDPQGGAGTDSEAFVALVDDALKRLAGMDVMGTKVQRATMYLTGPRGPDGRFRRQKLKVVDKHGFAHFGFNAKVNAFLDSGEPFYGGLRHEDLLAPPS